MPRVLDLSRRAEPFRLWRERHGFTQKEAGEWFGVNQATVARWERGEGHIPAPEGLPSDAAMSASSGRVETRDPPRMVWQDAQAKPAAAPVVTWHRQDGSPIDQAEADEIVRNTAGGQLPAAIALELLASHAAGRNPNYAQAQKDIEAAQAARVRPTPISYEAWRAANGVLNLPSRRG